MLFDALKKLSDERKQESKRKDAAYIYLDEEDNPIKEKKLDSAASALINRTMNKFKIRNPEKLIHNSMFGIS